ncbi:uncharacterized protein LOC136068726 [Quercus suber]|uniref:uncharacterized protein LOC136068726 n=1 Tax=Quercus suber TaxID=58331 RepID=UPI0032E02780
MAVHSKDETLMYKVFPSSLGPVVMRWFDSLKVDSISSFKELTQAFGSRFVIYQRVARPLASLLSLSMQEGETLKTYSDRYWEMFNEIEDDFEGVALSTFKLGLPIDHGLRKTLTGNQLLTCVSSWTVLTSIKELRKISSKERERKRLSLKRGGISGRTVTIAVNCGEILLDNQDQQIFKQSTLYLKSQYTKFWKRLRKIKNESFFKWPNKMVENPERRNNNLYCQYHQDHRHTTEDCRSLWDHLDQLVREGKLRQLLHHSSGRESQVNSEP